MEQWKEEDFEWVKIQSNLLPIHEDELDQILHDVKRRVTMGMEDFVSEPVTEDVLNQIMHMSRGESRCQEERVTMGMEDFASEPVTEECS